MTRPAGTVREVLIAARWILEHHKWVQGTFHRVDAGNHCFCLGGAINATLVADTDTYDGGWSILKQEARTVVGRVLHVDYGMDRLLSFVSWNDDPGRTKAEVLALLDRTIARCP